ncbi:MAG: glycosyltransferase family 39 protein [Candidatus Omnitrophota bacterium]|jgi:hypothetical protein
MHSFSKPYHRQISLALISAIVLFGCIFPQIFIPLLFVLAFIFVGASLARFGDKDNWRPLYKIFLSGLFLRLLICMALAVVSYKIAGHPFFLGADDYGNGLMASELVRIWKETGQLPLPKSLPWMLMAGDMTYAYALSRLYYFLGEYPLMPLFINCSFGALSIILIYLIGKEIYNHKVGLGAAAFFTLWPSVVLWSTQNLKEALTIFLILAIFYCVIKLRNGGQILAHWATASFAFFLLMKIRTPIAFFILFSLYFSLPFFAKQGRNRALFILSFFTISAFFIIIIYYMINKFTLELFDLTLNRFLASLQVMRINKMYAAESFFLKDIDISKPLNLLLNLPSFLAYIYFAPFPWQAIKPARIFASVEMLIWAFFSLAALKGILLSIRYKFKESVTILIFLLIMTFVFVGEGNIGTLFRHRAFIWPFLFLMTSTGLCYRFSGIKNLDTGPMNDNKKK